MPFKIIRNDITRMRVDAIVNTANEQPGYSDGTDTAVYLAAGAEELLAERKKIGVMAAGQAAVTPGFRLPAKYIIHAVSPRYEKNPETAEDELRSCYRESLRLAQELGCKSMAFPLIATGSFGYPKEEGMRIALDEINAFLLTREMFIYLVVFDEVSTGLGRSLYPDLEAYIDSHYVEEKEEAEYGGLSEWFIRKNVARPSMTDEAMGVPEGAMRPTPRRENRREREIYPKAKRSAGRRTAAREEIEPEESLSFSCSAPLADEADYDTFVEESEAALKERLVHLSDTFQEYLFYLIEMKGLTNADVYKRALLTKQLFSKIKLNPEYHPDKGTAMRLCVGAKLNPDETKDLLARAGYALSPCEKRDVIFSYFIEKGVYDMIEIDIALEEHGAECFIA